MRHPLTRALTATMLLLLAAGAQANGAMGLGLEMFDLRYWFAYVAAMVVLEAWLIGRWLKLPWPASLGLSLLANALTGVFCGGLGLCAPVLHMTFVGTPANPNPFMNAVALLSGLALPSAYVESILWRRAVKSPEHWPVVKRCLLVHAITVPVGLAILLIPERPYRGLRTNRQMLRHEVRRALYGYIQDKGAVPSSAEPRKLLAELQPYLKEPTDELIYAFYQPEMTRFSTGERWTWPMEINRAILGRMVLQKETGEEEWKWFMRPSPDAPGYRWGIAIEFNYGQVDMTRDEKVLGYE